MSNFLFFVVRSSLFSPKSTIPPEMESICLSMLTSAVVLFGKEVRGKSSPFPFLIHIFTQFLRSAQKKYVSLLSISTQFQANYKVYYAKRQEVTIFFSKWQKNHSKFNQKNWVGAWQAKLSIVQRRPFGDFVQSRHFQDYFSGRIQDTSTCTGRTSTLPASSIPASQ